MGEKRALPKDVLGAFSTAGVIHVLAVSGLHVGLVALFFLFVFKLLSPDKWATGATILALAIYALVTDLRPSVVRASIMAAVILIALAIERDSDIINTIGLAALIILIAWPQSLFELSFQLSFAATLSIVTLYRPILSLLPRVLKRGEGWWGKWIFSPLSISLAAQLGTAPIVALHFNRLPIISVMANIIVVPMIGVVLAFGILAAAFGFWLTYIATAFNAVNWLFLHTLIEIVRFLADVPRASLAVPTPSMFLLLGYFSLLVLIVIARRYMWAKKVFLVGGDA